MGKTTTPKSAHSGVVKTSTGTSNKHDTRTWFSSMVEQGRKAMFSGFFTITPDIARHILDYNPENRRIVKSSLRKCVKALQEGKFVVNGESIIVSKEGLLNDGQHRLQACVDTGISFVSNIAFGVEREARFSTDLGSSRSNGTMLAMHGVPHPNETAAAIGMYKLYKEGIYHHSASGLVSGEEEIEFYDTHKKLCDRMIHLYSNKPGRKLGAGALGAAYLILYPINAYEADVFFHKLVTGADLKLGDPILTLRARLNNEGIRMHVRLELILRAWNSWRKDEKREQCRSFDQFPAKLEA